MGWFLSTLALIFGIILIVLSGDVPDYQWIGYLFGTILILGAFVMAFLEFLDWEKWG